MKAAGYQDIQAEEIPIATLNGGGFVKVITGTFEGSEQSITGPISGITTAPLFFDIHLPSNQDFLHPVAADHNAFLYVYEGDLLVGKPLQSVPKQAAIILGDGDQIEVKAGAQGAKFILLAALPLHEPIVQYGPFVMNTRAEIEQAIEDYQNNRLTV